MSAEGLPGKVVFLLDETRRKRCPLLLCLMTGWGAWSHLALLLRRKQVWGGREPRRSD